MIQIVLAVVVVWGAAELTVSAETLVEQEGIELSGRVRRVARGVGTCKVLEESHSEEVYERMKVNQGQPLDVWRLDYAAYNGSGRALSFLSAHFKIASEWPPCTTWSGPTGRYEEPVQQWTGSFEVLQQPYGMEAGEEVSDMLYLLVFHSHRPKFESWDVNYQFGETRKAPAPAKADVRDSPARAPTRPQKPKRKPAPPKVRERQPFEPEMVEIPGGKFWMGCMSGKDCQENEYPVHEVSVRAFALSKYEVTFAEYDQFAAATGRAHANDEGWVRGRRPVINVSWVDAVAYTRWLSEQTGERYRLPSEAEWEYAARAGTETAYSWGNEIGHNRANCYPERCGDQWKETAPVGSFGPNGWGLHDMHGNVFEWVQDCWNESYRGAPTDGMAWEGGDCSQRVLRGGSRVSGSGVLRSAFRYAGTTSPRVSYIGFRVARTITP